MIKSYSPYSGTEETCYVKGMSGLFYAGVRIENISFPLTISAVQAAVCSCLANGDTPDVLYQGKPESELLQFWIDEFSLEHRSELPAAFERYQPLVSSIPDIPETLEELCSSALTQHSDFPVSAILETENGYITGVNVEVKAWGLGLCAERVALSRAISSGCTGLTGMHIFAPESTFCSPCGACRQVLYEHMPDRMVELYHTKTSLTKHYVHHLLPFGITTEFLKKRY